MEIYIASKYISHKLLNERLWLILTKNDIKCFLPQSININAVSQEQMKDVSEKCYQALERCNVILVVSPFGQSVSCEIGYSIALQKKGNEKHIIVYNYNNQEELWKNEAMILPYVEAQFNNFDELIEYCKELKQKYNYKNYI